MLEIKNVTKKYDGHLALNNVSLRVTENSIYGLLGPNGAGKTTLIRIINRITAPDMGEVLLEGKPLRAEDVLHIGYLPEERGLYKKMKVGEQAMYLAQLKGLSKHDAQKALKYWFEKFEIQAWWDKKIEELSTGMAQKVQFITTVLHEPKLLILDEPFSGFDPVNAELIRKEVLNLQKKGSTIILSTHNMESVETLCENISLINKAEIVLQGAVSEIKKANSTNTFRLCTEGELTGENANFTFEQQTGTTLHKEYHVKKKQTLTNNELLAELMQQCEISTFNEILPSMNEIFIKTVSK